MAFSRLLLIGCGNMSGAMLEGWLAGGIAPDIFTIVDPARAQAPGALPVLREVPQGGDSANDKYDAILLGVKPQMLGDVAAQIEPLAGEGTIILSLLAGVEIATLRSVFPRAPGHVRIMPNLAASLGKAPIALAAGPLMQDARAAIGKLMAPLGSAHWIDEENMDLVTALAGSGPAFVYRFIDALRVAAVRLGLSDEQAGDLALMMVDGAATLAAQSDYDPAQLADMVASKGGVTREGLKVLDRNDALADLLTNTLRAARDRSAEIAQQAGK